MSMNVTVHTKTLEELNQLYGMNPVNDTGNVKEHGYVFVKHAQEAGVDLTIAFLIGLVLLAASLFTVVTLTCYLIFGTPSYRSDRQQQLSKSRLNERYEVQSNLSKSTLNNRYKSRLTLDDILLSSIRKDPRMSYTSFNYVKDEFETFRGYT